MQVPLHGDGPPGDASVVVVVVRLVRLLRGAGVPVSTGETIDAVTALAEVGLGERAAVRDALRLTLVKSSGHVEVFERLFAVVFPATPGAGDQAQGLPGAPGVPDERGQTKMSGGADAGGELREALAAAMRRQEDVAALLEEAVGRWAGIGATPGGERHHLTRVLRRLDLAQLMRALLRDGPDVGADAEEFERRIAAAEAEARIAELRERLAEVVRGQLPVPPAGAPEDIVLLHASPEELARLRTAVRPLARRIAARLSRRQRSGHSAVDMRRTIRASMGSGGVPLYPAMRRRHRGKPDLVVLCDVSGSVAPFASFTLALLHALHAEFRRIRSFAFVDGVVEITERLESAPGVLDVHHLLARRGLVVGDGRSDYRRALRAFQVRWPEAVTARTTVLIIGDARSHDRPPALAEAARLKHGSRRLYWFNPEPHHEWDTGDSIMSAYARYCTRTFEVSSLSQLVDAVTAIA